jgi:hypothetical protein
MSAIIACVTNSGTRSVYTRRRILMLAAARTELEKTKAAGRTLALVVGNTTTPVVATGFTGSATLAKSISLIAGYTNLYKVTVSITWVEKTGGPNRNDSLTLETWMRSPDA